MAEKYIDLTPEICSIDGCERPRRKRDWCNTHYARWRRHGSTDDGAMRFDTPEESFAYRTERRGECLIWTGAVDRNGYGQFKIGGKAIYAHRWSWEQANGTIPGGMVVDHADHCDPACVDVKHLRLATRAENNQNRAGANPNNKSTGIRGVYPDAKNCGYIVRVGNKYRGYSKTIEGAAVLAEKVRKELYGDFAGKGSAENV